MGVFGIRLILVVGDDGEFEPVVELRQALNDADEAESRFWVLEHGEGRDVP